MPRPAGLNEEAIPSDGRLLRHARRAQEHAQHARLLARLALEAGDDVKLERPARRGFQFEDPVDLRGLPAVGRGVGGVIRGTSPHAAIERLDGPSKGRP